MVDGDEVAGSVWSPGEIDLIVAEYFWMLEQELAGRGFNKRERNRGLREFVHRSHASIEFKHRNISAVLAELGHPWIAGYKPGANYQRVLTDGVERYLDERRGMLDYVPSVERSTAYRQIIIEEPPQPLSLDPRSDAATRRLVAKFDPAARDARNRALGKQGEAQVFQAEVERLSAAGRNDLASKVIWTAEELGDGAGYDILSFAINGSERLLEVKTTLGRKNTPFFLTHNEKCVSEERPEVYRIVRLFDFAHQPRAFRLAPPWDQHFLLRPSVYLASFC